MRLLKWYYFVFLYVIIYLISVGIDNEKWQFFFHLIYLAIKLCMLQWVLLSRFREVSILGTNRLGYRKRVKEIKVVQNFSPIKLRGLHNGVGKHEWFRKHKQEEMNSKVNNSFSEDHLFFGQASDIITSYQFNSCSWYYVFYPYINLWGYICVCVQLLFPVPFLTCMYMWNECMCATSTAVTPV